MRKLTIGAAALGLIFTLSSCREVDVNEVNGELIHGTSSQYRFCDGPTLIYFTDVSGSDDEFDAIWPGMCTLQPDGSWRYDFEAAANQVNKPNGNVEDK